MLSAVPFNQTIPHARGQKKEADHERREDGMMTRTHEQLPVDPFGFVGPRAKAP
jgi:hypothetical protein